MAAAAARLDRLRSQREAERASKELERKERALELKRAAAAARRRAEREREDAEKATEQAELEDALRLARERKVKQDVAAEGAERRRHRHRGRRLPRLVHGLSLRRWPRLFSPQRKQHIQATLMHAGDLCASDRHSASAFHI